MTQFFGFTKLDFVLFLCFSASPPPYTCDPPAPPLALMCTLTSLACCSRSVAGEQSRLKGYPLHVGLYTIHTLKNNISV